MKKQLFLSLALAAVSLFTAKEAVSAAAVCTPNPFSGFSAGLSVGASKLDSKLDSNNVVNEVGIAAGTLGGANEKNLYAKKTAAEFGAFFNYMWALGDGRVLFGLNLEFSASTAKAKKEHTYKFITNPGDTLPSIGRATSETALATGSQITSTSLIDSTGNGFGPAGGEYSSPFYFGTGGYLEYIVPTSLTATNDNIKVKMTQKDVYDSTKATPKTSGELSVKFETKNTFSLRLAPTVGFMINDKSMMFFSVGLVVGRFKNTLNSTLNITQTKLDQEVIGFELPTKTQEIGTAGNPDFTVNVLSDENAVDNKNVFFTDDIAEQFLADHYKEKPLDAINLNDSKSVTVPGITIALGLQYQIVGNFFVFIKASADFFNSKKIKLSSLETNKKDKTLLALKDKDVTAKYNSYAVKVGVGYKF